MGISATLSFTSENTSAGSISDYSVLAPRAEEASPGSQNIGQMLEVAGGITLLTLERQPRARDLEFHSTIADYYALGTEWVFTARDAQAQLLSVIQHVVNRVEPSTLAQSLRTHFHASPAAYSWQRRLADLQRWRGDVARGEPNRLSRVALAIAYGLAEYADRHLGPKDTSVVKTVLSALPDGGVQMEWTIPNDPSYHLEIAAHSGGGGVDNVRLDILQTRERPSGEILDEYELEDASPVEALSTVVRFLSAFARR